MNEPITDAKVILIESETSGSFLSFKTTCKTIAESTVDADGYCYFDNERLKKNGQYACKVSYAYGKPQTNNCTVTQTSKITAGQNNDRILHDETYEAYVKLQVNNALNPSISGDSLNIGIATPRYQVPGQPYPYGGGGVLGATYSTSSPYFPFPVIQISNAVKTDAGKNPVYIRKRKMGVLTIILDTIKIQPYQTATYVVNW